MDRETMEALATFEEELEARLGTIRRTAANLGVHGTEAGVEVVHELFRQFHSLKSAANLLDLRPVEQLAHRVEDVLALAREDRLTPQAPLPDLVLAVAKRMEQLGGHLRRLRVVDIGPDLHSIDRFVARYGSGIA